MVVALHTLDADRIPLNVTSLVNEWALHLDPVAEIAASPASWFDDAWAARGHFAVPDWWTVEALRQAARNERVIERFANASASLRMPKLGKRWQAKLKAMVRRGDDGDVMRLERGALPVLLGLAVYAAVQVPIGLKGQEVTKRLQDYWDTWEDPF